VLVLTEIGEGWATWLAPSHQSPATSWSERLKERLLLILHVQVAAFSLRPQVRSVFEREKEGMDGCTGRAPRISAGTMGMTKRGEAV
jgi:hypothetical protein